MSERNSIQFTVRGRYALFTDPVSHLGGEKCSYHLPTYEALAGVARSIYWKPTIIWLLDKVRVMKPIRTVSKGVKPLDYGGGSTLSMYTYLADVEYQVSAHFEWNEQQPQFAHDRNENKHWDIAKRSLRRGGRYDIFLGTRECQGDVESVEFGTGKSYYDGTGEIAYPLMFHGFDYPTPEREELWVRFWQPVMRDGVIEFCRPADCKIRRKVASMPFVRCREKGESHVLDD